jgi:hypothetical protein
MDFYNGYSGKERDKKYEEYKRQRAAKLSVPAIPPCQLCGDDKAEVQPHSEDYSFPYRWLPPAEYMVCRSCHGWIHKRFNKPDDWNDFKSHIRRGGFGGEFSTPAFSLERKEAAASRNAGRDYEWRPIVGRPVRQGTDWWEHLTLGKESLTASWARPRR